MKEHLRTVSVALLAISSLLGGTIGLSAGANAGTLLGPGNTVQAFYFNSVFASPEGEIPVGGSTTDPAPLTAPVNYQQGAADGSLITVGAGTSGNQIAITNLLSGLPGTAFCLDGSAGSNCGDQIDGFKFLFTNEHITGVSVDSSSDADFQPVNATYNGNAHLGLQLISLNEIIVDVTGELPGLNHQLVLNITTASVTPIPATLPLFVSGLGALGLLGWRRKRKAASLAA